MNSVFKFGGWVLSLLLLGFLVFNKMEQKTVVEEIWPEKYLPLREWSVNPPEMKASGALVSYKDKILWEKSGDDRFAIASITKLMTAMVAVDKYDLKDSLELDIWESDSMVMGGQVYLIEDLLHAMLIGSSNVAAHNLVSVEEINNKASELKLINTTFTDTSGLKNNISTPRELTIVIREVITNYPFLLDIMAKSEYLVCSKSGVCFPVVNTNQILPLIGKTGFTEEAGRCFISLEEWQNDWLISVVLHSEDRFNETLEILEWAKKAYIYDR